MITVAGFNTSLDRYVEVPACRVGEVMRVRHVDAAPGGKGAHVALTCAALGQPVRLVGVTDRDHAGPMRDLLAAQGVEFVGVEISGELRTCLAIREDSGRTTELLEPGRTIGEAACGDLTAHVTSAGGPSNVVAFSGSVPPGFADERYGRLVAALTASGARTLVDASGSVLRCTLSARPFLVKLNRDEAGELTGTPIQAAGDALTAARQLAARGTRRAIVSLGADGLVAAWDGRACHVTAPSRQVLNAVGAGDCLLGGIAVGLARGLPAEETLRLGVACGAAKTGRRETGRLDARDVEAVGASVRVHWLE